MVGSDSDNRRLGSSDSRPLMGACQQKIGSVPGKISPFVPFARSDICCIGKKIFSVFSFRTEDFVHFNREGKNSEKILNPNPEVDRQI